MKNITIFEPVRASIPANQMRVGQLGLTNEGEVLLRIYGDRWVSLCDPSSIWALTLDTPVQIVPPGSTVSFITT